MDHRQGERHATDCPASLSVREGKHRIGRCRIRNLSRDGVYIEYPAGEREPIVEYDFVEVIPGGHLADLHLEGIVCHASRNGAGIMLKAPLERSQTALLREVLETAA